jgi:hypothetical protein
MRILQELYIEEGYTEDRKREEIQMTRNGKQDANRKKLYGAKSPESSG